MFAIIVRNKLNIGSHRNNLSLIGAQNLWINIQNMISGVFLLFGGVARKGDVSIFSIEGIGVLMRFGFLIICFGVICREIKLKKENPTLLYFYCITLLNLGIYSVTNSLYGQDIFEHRYHILWCYMMLHVTAHAVTDDFCWKNKVLQRILCWGLILLVAGINISEYNVLSKYGEGKKYERAVLLLADEYGAENIIAYNNSGSMYSLQAMDPNRNTVSYWYDEDKLYADILDTYYYSAENVYSGGKHLFLCPIWEFDSLPEYIKNSYVLISDDIVAARSGHNVYYADHSMWDGYSGLPAEKMSKSVDFPYSPGYEYKGVINEEGRLVVESDEDGYVLWGPFRNAVPGVYNITLEYDIVKDGLQVAFFDVSTDMGENILIRQPLINDKNAVTLESVSITGYAPLEFRVYQYADGSMIINRIVFERIAK